MTRIPLYQIDAFTDRLFSGNPAALCPLENWLEEKTMQAIAAENNLAETAFLVPEGDSWGLRWFTPTSEVDLCGHATLASAFWLFEQNHCAGDVVRFSTRSGILSVTRSGDLLELDFPALRGKPVTPPEPLTEGLGCLPGETILAKNYMAVFETQAQVAALTPDMTALATLHPAGVIATAPGDDCDFVSRFFAPSYGIPEDPVTGSAHCTLIPYWSERLEREKLFARQISGRGGELYCEARGDRVCIAGRAVLYLEGSISLPG
jgi:predicted PhzF superfamily epimerase YddE/YHI9